MSHIAHKSAEPHGNGADPFNALDRSYHSVLAGLTQGISPVAGARAWFDWFAHLQMAPGKQAELMLQAWENATRLSQYAVQAAAVPDTEPGFRPSAGDRRFAGDGWKAWPYSLLAQTQLATEQWWQSATSDVRGTARQSTDLVQFGLQQMLRAASPSNWLATNPELARKTLEQGGRNLVEGMGNLTADLTRALTGETVDTGFEVGRNLALTPGKVVLRNRVLELIQYEPATPTVHPEPVLIVPAWIMKYYILDLRPENSLIKFLVDRGHTVFAISWKNPTEDDRELGMEDYRRLGIMAALDAVSAILPERKVHACGYCLGGTLLSIAAAAMARDGDDRLASMTLFTAQTDFSEAGELTLFINDTALSWLDSLMASKGFLDGPQMGGAFSLLRAEDMIWSPMVRHYILGEQDKPNDLMAWNADQTRMPHRMHTEYLTGMFLHNDLAEGRYKADGRPVALCDISAPIFAVGTAKDHVAPWHSAFKIHLFTRTEVTFVLASGGHNAGIVADPGRPGRNYQVMTRGVTDRYVDPDRWTATAPRREGSWWLEWQSWLAGHSGPQVAPPAMGAAQAGYAPLCDAPGDYVRER